MLCFLIAALLPMANRGSVQDPSIQVTYSTKAARTSVVLKELSQTTKLNLVASPQTENDVLVISVKDVPLADLMARIATVTSGQWKQDGTTYRLIADAKTRKTEEQTDLAERVADIRKAIQSRVDQQKKSAELMQKMIAENEKKLAAAKKDAKVKTKESDDDDVNFQEGMMETPEDQAITSILQSIDPSILASLEDGDRVVFSTDPTHTQRGLSSDVTEIVNTLIQKHNSAILGTQGNAIDDSDQFKGMDEAQANLIRQMMKKQTSKIGQVSKALFIASVTNSMIYTQFQLELRLYDPKGGVAFTANSFLSADGSMFGNMALPPDSISAVSSSGSSDGDAAVLESRTTTISANAAPKPQGKSTPIEYSPDSQELAKAGKGMGIGAGQYTMHFSQDLRQKLFLPNQYDPLSFIETDELMMYAKSKGKPLVANLPDNVSSIFSMLGTQGADTLEAYADTLKKGKTIVALEDSAYTLIRPTHPYRARVARLDRNALTNLLQATADKGIPSLDELSAYATVAPNPMSGGIGMGYLMMFVPGTVQMGMDGLTSWDMLRFYGQLPSETRNTLANGGKVTIGSLTAGQRASLERMTYGSSSHLSVDDPQRKSDDETPSWMKLAMGSNSIDYRDEPTEIVPNGLPNDGFLDLKGTNEPFAAPVATPDSMVMAMLGVLGPDELALFKMLRSTKGAEAFSNMFPKFGKLRIGDRSVLNFTFHVAPQVSLKQTLKDHHLDKNSTVVSEDTLPADLQKKISEREEAMKKSPFGNLASMFGGGPAIHP